MQYQVENYSLKDLQNIASNWAEELKQAVTGEKTSLVFAKHQIQSQPRKNQKALVVVVGGSHLIVSEIIRQEGVIEILTYQKTSLPTLDSKEILFDLLTNQIPGDISRIALNFAYPLEPVFRNNLVDGRLIAPSKEHRFTGLINKVVGQELENYLQGKLGKKFEVAVANDTVCLVLAGLAQSKAKNLAGGIVGTGFNFGLFTDSQTLVNLEAANFDKFKQTSTGQAITQQSQDPSKGWYEKELSGAYLYKHYNLLAEDLGFARVESTADLSNLAAKNLPESEIARGLFGRSAALVAAQIAGIYKYKQQHTLHLVMEGSLFWGGWNYKNLAYEHLRELGLVLGTVKVFKVERSYLLGAGELII